jgi:hypothetical protein
MTELKSKPHPKRSRRVSVGLLLLALTALLNAGCILAAVGAAGVGAAAAGYTYYNGLFYRDYKANINDSLAAVHASLQELGFPITKEKTDTGSVYLTSSTGDGHTVRIYLDLVSSPIPAEGALTRVGVRVGFSGDEVVSARILDQVSRHLGAPAPPPPAVVMAPAPAPGPAPAPAPAMLPDRPVPETRAPPLATSLPANTK